MAFIEQIVEWDKQLLLLGNSFHTPFLDDFMLIFSGKLIWIPAAIAILYAVVRTQRRDALWVIVFLALAIVAADQLSSGVIKPLVARLRPTHEPTLAGLVQVVHDYTGGRYGFVSSHAANACAVALFTSLLFRRTIYSVTMTLWAGFDMYTRIYLGVHYPGDIICGAAIGIMVALAAFALMKRFAPRTLTHTDEMCMDRCVYTIVSVVAVSVLCSALFHHAWPMLA
ncbi:MAG: phosphatase PAP2 family protein [Bacteroidales bacterium]|nr:phosphatase PAP2 family protein [Bacteroidales bacterium]